MQVIDGFWSRGEEPEVGDYGQWHEYDAEVVGVDREERLVYLELSDGDTKTARFR